MHMNVFRLFLAWLLLLCQKVIVLSYKVIYSLKVRVFVLFCKAIFSVERHALISLSVVNANKYFISFIFKFGLSLSDLSFINRDKSSTLFFCSFFS